MKEIKSSAWGKDITHIYQEMIKAKEPTFCNCNGVYLYGGCKTPPHKCADQQTERHLLAGMMMQALVGAICGDKEKVESVLLDCIERDVKNIHEWCARTAIDYTDALMNEFEKENIEYEHARMMAKRIEEKKK